MGPVIYFVRQRVRPALRFSPTTKMYLGEKAYYKIYELKIIVICFNSLSI